MILCLLTTVWVIINNNRSHSLLCILNNWKSKKRTINSIIKDALEIVLDCCLNIEYIRTTFIHITYHKYAIVNTTTCLIHFYTSYTRQQSYNWHKCFRDCTLIFTTSRIRYPYLIQFMEQMAHKITLMLVLFTYIIYAHGALIADT